jgi:hypothetical protein
MNESDIQLQLQPLEGKLPLCKLPGIPHGSYMQHVVKIKLLAVPLPDFLNTWSPHKYPSIYYYILA